MTEASGPAEALNLAFLLPPTVRFGGAAHIVDLVAGLRRAGHAARVLAPEAILADVAASCPDLVPGAVDLIPAPTGRALAGELEGADIACATDAATLVQLQSAIRPRRDGRGPAIACLLGDFEPLFLSDRPTEGRAARTAFRSAETRFLAGSDWLRLALSQGPGIDAAHVSPSLDHRLFRPELGRERPDGALTIVATLRPGLARRGPLRTLRTLDWIARTLAGRARIEVFGCTDAALDAAALVLPAGCTNHGPLARAEVASLLRRADLLLDLSDYRAIGRGGLEAMACGCTPLLPILGAAAEYANDANALLVDTRRDEAIRQAISRFFAMSSAGRAELRARGLQAAAAFSTERAAADLYVQLRRLVRR
jgi:glycosyltransferase involved in cell wall biosynthesis